MEETPPNPKPIRPRGHRPPPATTRPREPGSEPAAVPRVAPGHGQAIVASPRLRHLDAGVFPLDGIAPIILAAEGCGDAEGRLVEGLRPDDFLLTLVDDVSGLLVHPVADARLSEIGAGLYRYELEKLPHPGRYHLLVTDSRHPPRFHPILGRFEARLVASTSFLGAEPEIAASIVFVSSANLIKARIGVRQGGRRVPFDQVTLQLYDERSRTPIRLDPIAVDPDHLGLAELEARGAVAQGLRIYACVVSVRIAGEVWESTRLYPVVRTAP